MLIESLQNCVEVLVGWAPQYLFDPWAVEISFGAEEHGLQAWRLDLGNGHALELRGRIDRVDLHPRTDGSAEAVVMDYKSGGQKLEDTKLHNGLDLQLLAYLGVLRDNPRAQEIFGASKLIPAGAFYVGLRGRGGSSASRQEAFADAEKARKEPYRHSGRFDWELLPLFDHRGEPKGDQFRFTITKNGKPGKRGDALPAGEFPALVTKVENFLRDYGGQIYAGNVSIAPYRINKKIACDYCDYAGLCRFDRWTEPFRVFRKEPATAETNAVPEE